ncbi:flagellar protein FliT [Lysinibacillus fusiformis]|uniref:flagellar protein FliT n=1 Tax=Lysinibacillus fusiformis TaxID=28031 RepID=UPI0021C10BAF|nr:flagellar protein FliT [Lysinibacillus fusiformis]UXJ69549.1 flagellar protein FliT [Lysinibacillus fusiformis]
MMDIINDYLQISAQLFKYLITIPQGEERTQYIEKINDMLDERGLIVEKLKKNNFLYDSSNKIHHTMLELDKGIQERLDLVYESVKLDMKDFLNAKKNEIQYINPYESLQNLDGRYFDGKK